MVYNLIFNFFGGGLALHFVSQLSRFRIPVLFAFVVSDILLAHSKYRLEDQVFVNRNPEAPQCLLFHPYQSELLAADKNSIS